MYLDHDFSRIPAKELYPKLDKSNPPQISVIVLVYNHASYLEEAIRSIICQKVPIQGFFEILIGEDCSSDSSFEICLEFKKQYPKLIRLITSSANVGMHRNFARLWHHALGKYIACCEGDDYWIDDQKLIKQYEFLEYHSRHNMCATYTDVLEKVNGGNWSITGSIKPPMIQKDYSLEDMIMRYNFHFSSIMLRKESICFPSWFWDVYCVDRPLYLLAVKDSLVGLIPETTSVYRLHSGGSWSSVNLYEKAEKSIHLFNKLASFLPTKYTPTLHRALSNVLWSYSSTALGKNDLKAAKILLYKSIRYTQIVDYKELIIRLISISFKTISKQ